MSRSTTLETLLQPWRAMRHGIESSLFRKGVRNASVRTLLTRQCLLAVVALAGGVVGGFFHPWLLHFGLGVGIVTANFYFLATSIARRLESAGQPGGQGPLVASTIVRFYGRLILTGVLLAVLLVFGKISLAALLAGLSTVVATILIWGVESYLAQHSKEA